MGGDQQRSPIKVEVTADSIVFFSKLVHRERYGKRGRVGGREGGLGRGEGGGDVLKGAGLNNSLKYNKYNETKGMRVIGGIGWEQGGS